MSAVSKQNQATLEYHLRYKAIDDKEYHKQLERHYSGDAGLDLTCSRTITVPPLSFAEIPTNIQVALPRNAWGLILGRSSTFARKGLYVNPGVIDNGWRGELLSMVYNMTSSPVTVRKGERITQIIPLPLYQPSPIEVDSLPKSSDGRGTSGFGSTGTGESTK